MINCVEKKIGYIDKCGCWKIFALSIGPPIDSVENLGPPHPPTPLEC